MNKPWLLLIVAFFFQENLLVNFAISEAKLAGINWIPITFIWFVLTVLDIVIPYFLTKLIFSKISDTRFGKRIDALSKKANTILMRRGRTLGLILMGAFIYIHLDGVIAAWLDVDWKTSFVLLFIGDLLWYLGVMGLFTVTGFFISDIRIVFAIVCVMAFCITFILRKVWKRSTTSE